MGMGPLSISSLRSAPSWCTLALTSVCIFSLGNSDAFGRGVKAPSEHTLYRQARAAGLVGKAITVTGPVDPASLGTTLMHEHLFIDWFAHFPWPAGGGLSTELARQIQESGWPLPTNAAETRLFDKRELDLADIDLLRRGARSRANYLIDDEELITREVAAFQKLDGRTIVDVTPEGLGRNLPRLARFSRANGITVVAGTGWYRWPFHTKEVHDADVSTLAALLVDDVLRGSRSSGVKSGIIGEIPLDSRSVHSAAGSSNSEVRARSEAARARLLSVAPEARDSVPVEEIYDAQELKVLRAATRASRLTGAALTLHANDPWTGYLSVVINEGGDLSRTIVGHAHYIFRDPALLQLALAKGVVLEADYDLQQYPTRAPVGAFEEILDGVAWAITHGYASQVLLSQDICNKVGLQQYGGGGYVTLHNYVFPYLKAKGVTDEQLLQVMVENPKRLLTLTFPQTPR